jgi:hypothetical protein
MEIIISRVDNMLGHKINLNKFKRKIKSRYGGATSYNLNTWETEAGGLSSKPVWAT